MSQFVFGGGRLALTPRGRAQRTSSQPRVWPMTNNVYLVLELEVPSGREADVAALMGELVETTRENEPRTLDFEWWTSTDGRRCHMVERYADSAAAMSHLGAFRDRFAERF